MNGRIVQCSNLQRDVLLSISKDVVELIRISSQELFSELFGNRYFNTLEKLFLVGNNLFGYENVCVYIDEEKNSPIGIILFFDDRKIREQSINTGL
ncbi:MAG: hypothetical protein ABDH28_05745, partial [Brevinematia bacterium]